MLGEALGARLAEWHLSRPSQPFHLTASESAFLASAGRSDLEGAIRAYSRGIAGRPMDRGFYAQQVFPLLVEPLLRFLEAS